MSKEDFKTAKVIATSFIERDVRNSTSWYEHGQNLGDSDAVLDMLRDIVQKDREIDPGIPMDTIIVNNDSGYAPGKEYLKSIAETPTKSGRFIIINRENWGRSFGAYNAAFFQYKDQYDYWLFSEDDMFFSKDGYAKEYLNVLDENEKTAFVAAIGIGRPDERTKHAHGGCGFTHRKYMEETIPVEFNYIDNLEDLEASCGEIIGPAFKTKGSLAHLSKQSLNFDSNYSLEEQIKAINKETRLHCICGEVPFTYSLLHLGYNIITLKNPKQWYEFYE